MWNWKSPWVQGRFSGLCIEAIPRQQIIIKVRVVSAHYRSETALKPENFPMAAAGDWLGFWKERGSASWVNEIFVGWRYWDYQTRKLFFIKSLLKNQLSICSCADFIPMTEKFRVWPSLEGRFVIKLFIELIIEPLTPIHTRSGGSGQSEQPPTLMTELRSNSTALVMI